MDSTAGYKTLHVLNSDGTERQYGLIKTDSLWGAWNKNPDGSGDTMNNIIDNRQFYTFRKSALNYLGDDGYFYVLPCRTATASTSQTSTWNTSDWDEFSDSEYPEFEGDRYLGWDRTGIARIIIEFPIFGGTVYFGTDLGDIKSISCDTYKMRIIYDVITQKIVVQRYEKLILNTYVWKDYESYSFHEIGEDTIIGMLIAGSDITMDVTYWEYTYD